ncbi:hypothetical protein KPH14_009426 [Odynerus spinipes]|uniref:Uncharacterized protein n=1 Tax=Odynerus spinipes TaxID=1348599 RepID=A0AAD9RPA2_9HYME|nr:hypothetical protein KPH14_009426 [Odynerus spinipes]
MDSKSVSRPLLRASENIFATKAQEKRLGMKDMEQYGIGLYNVILSPNKGGEAKEERVSLTVFVIIIKASNIYKVQRNDRVLGFVYVQSAGRSKGEEKQRERKKNRIARVYTYDDRDLISVRVTMSKSGKIKDPPGKMIAREVTFPLSSPTNCT